MTSTHHRASSAHTADHSSGHTDSSAGGHHWPRVAWRGLFATVLAITVVAALILNPASSRVQASGVFGGLRGPGELGFIAAHRGDAVAGPENTLPALRAALEGPSTFVEVDVQLTKDHVPVLFHDHWLNRTTDGEGRIRDHTWAELQQLDAGAWFGGEFAGTRIPTLAQFLELLTVSDAKGFIELKGFWTPSEAAIVVELINAHGLRERALLASFDTTTLTNVAQADSRMMLAIVTSTLPDDPAAYAMRYGALAVVTSFASLEQQPWAVEHLHRAGIGVMLYTLNTKVRWEHALALGVDGIVTDRPRALGEWIERVRDS